MKFLIIQLIVIGAFCGVVICTGYFTIVGSKLLRQNGKYSVAITSRNFEDTDDPTLEVAIQNSNGEWNRAENITLINGKIQTLEFDIKGQPLDAYILGVKSVKGADFNQVVKLNINTKNVSVFVQTDKAIYKPNDTVQFRVLFLNENLKPLNESNVGQIHIIDNVKNRVKQFDDVTFIKGVFQSDFKLSELPVLGDWHVDVFVNKKKEASKTFEVAEYTLPNFQFTIDVNPHANLDQRKITAVLVAKYTFGKIAKGNATITAEVDYHKVTKSIEVNGKKLVEFDIENDLGIKNKGPERRVKLFASFKEKLTGRVQNTTANIQVHLTPHKIQIQSNSKKFKPGLPFTLRAIVLHHDKNAPVTDNQNPVRFTATLNISQDARRLRNRQTQDECYEDMEDELSFLRVWQAYPTNGIAEIDIQIPDNVTKMDIRAKYLETENGIYEITKPQFKSNEYIKIKSKTKKPQLTENVTINIQSTKDIHEFTYHVFSTKGAVVASGTIVIISGKSDFDFTPTYDMPPKAMVIVFYITSDGEIISDSLEIEFDNHLSNFINIKIPKGEARPSEQIDISITSNPNSFVGLLGVDQSVLLLKKGNDIEESTVFDDLKQYNDVNRRYQKSIPYYEEKRYLDFESPEFFIITNAKEDKCGYVETDEESTTGWGRFGTDHSVWTEGTDDTPLRKTFPETWFFDSFNFGFNQTNATISRKVPHSITSWIITGFSVDPVTGLGLTKQPTKLNVFQPFFVTMNLPYSIRRGEIVSIPISVFNYVEHNLTVEVTLYNEDPEFEFIDARGKLRHNGAIANLKTKNIVVLSQQSNFTSFMIRPLRIGLIKIKVVANSPIARDGIERYLLVQPEGVTQHMNKAISIDLTDSDKFQTVINIDIPANVGLDSIKIEAWATGDILGTSITNLDKLIKLPYRSGERVLNFVSNIVVLDYLTAVDKLTPEIKEKANKSLEIGFQSVLNCRHDDGSYSIWGKRDKSGSTWLTALVTMSLRQASKYFSFDTEIIKQALEFLSQAQLTDGSFKETFLNDIQGGSSNEIALTAHILITFLDNTDFVDTYKITINRALAFLNESYQSVTDNYSLAMMAYALHLADHSLKNIVLSKLETRAITGNGTIYWRKKTSASENPSNKVSSLDVEMTAYALQAFLVADRITDSIKIMKWLVSQRNKNGGFTSTRDTVVGLQALSKMSKKMYGTNTNIDITVHINTESSTLQVNELNALILQKCELPPTAKYLEITAQGHGFSIFQLSYQYNIDNSSVETGSFTINPIVNSTASSENVLYLQVCTNFIPEETIEKSDVTIMEVTFPSGLVCDREILPELESTTEVKKVEIKDRGTVVVVYFDYLSVTGVCLEFIAHRDYNIAMQKPASIKVYDICYTNRQAVAFYNLPEILVCDIYDDDKECLQECDEMDNDI